MTTYKRATLFDYKPDTKEFVYRLSEPYFVRPKNPRTEWITLANTFTITRTFFRTILSCPETGVLSWSVGVVSHSAILRDFSFAREIDPTLPGRLDYQSLIDCLTEFQKTGDTVSIFLEELIKR